MIHASTSIFNQSIVISLQCSTSCGKGMRHRRVYCQGFDGRDVGEAECSLADKPATGDICDMGSCSANTWFFTEWSGQVRFLFLLLFCLPWQTLTIMMIHCSIILHSLSHILTFFIGATRAVFGGMRNWHPDAQSSLLRQQRGGLRLEQETGHI